jgi:hypothetical protein
VFAWNFFYNFKQRFVCLFVCLFLGAKFRHLATKKTTSSAKNPTKDFFFFGPQKQISILQTRHILFFEENFKLNQIAIFFL